MLDKILLMLNQLTEKHLLKKKKKEEKNKDLIWSRKFGDNHKVIFNISDNSKIYLYKDSGLSRLIYNGFEKDELDFVNYILSEGDTFIDIGSNVGLFSLVASPKVGIYGKVLAYEPSPTTCDKLRENTTLNGFTNIIVRNLGLSNNQEKLQFNVSNEGFDAWNSFAMTESHLLKSQIIVNVKKLDDEIEYYNPENVKLIKIDVEGWEKYVLLGSQKLLTEYSPIVMLEFTETNAFAAGYMVQENYDLLKNFGYDLFEYKNKKLYPSPKKIHYPYNNLIAIKNIHEAIKGNQKLESIYSESEK